MDDFFRPEVRAFFLHWREVIFAGALAFFGIWWALTGIGITQWLGVVFSVLGVAWAVAALQGARFAQDQHRCDRIGDALGGAKDAPHLFMQNHRFGLR